MAQGKLRELVAWNFMRGQGAYYDSPYHLEIWDLDGARLDSFDDMTHQITLQQVAKMDPQVEELERRKRVADEQDKLLQEYLAQEKELIARQKEALNNLTKLRQ